MSAALTSLGTCVIPAGTLKAGDRVEIRFDYAHTGGLERLHISRAVGRLDGGDARCGARPRH